MQTETLHGSINALIITCFPADIVSYISSTYDFFSSIHCRNISVIFPRHDRTPAAQLASIKRVLWNLKRRIEEFVKLPSLVIDSKLNFCCTFVPHANIFDVKVTGIRRKTVHEWSDKTTYFSKRVPWSFNPSLSYWGFVKYATYLWEKNIIKVHLAAWHGFRKVGWVDSHPCRKDINRITKIVNI